MKTMQMVIFKVLTPLVLLYSSLELRATIKRIIRDKLCPA